MDPIKNPFAPGAGSPPPELAGRDDLIESIRISLGRKRIGRASKSVLLLGLRGVGKTVLLDRMRHDAIAAGDHTIRMEAPENLSLPALIAPQLRNALLRLSREERTKHSAMQALQALAGFAKALKVKYRDIEVGFDYDPVPGLADNGNLAEDLKTLFEMVGTAAAQADTGFVLFIDELQYVEENQLEALISALHLVSQQNLPITLVGAGLPQLAGKMGSAKSYAERLFDFPTIGPLDRDSAIQAIKIPIQTEGATIDDEVLDRVLEITKGYPYFLQEWGKHMWDLAPSSHITMNVLDKAEALVIAALDSSFFRVRLDRLTPMEKTYLRAMSELGPGPHRSGDIAKKMDRSVTSLGPVRTSLIMKGMIYSPIHGDTAFTVPLFDEFMKRVMP